MWPEVGQGRALEGARREEVELLLMDDSDQQRAQAAESSLTAAMDMVSRCANSSLLRFDLMIQSRKCRLIDT